MTSDAEKAFLTMAKMVNHREAWVSYMRANTTPHIMEGFHGMYDRWERELPPGSWVEWITFHLFKVSHLFPIVASTFATLCQERPELQEHFDRAKQAWEASQ